MMTMAIHRDTPVSYDDKEHKYYVGDIRYLSATQVVDRFVNHFDTPERASYMADRYGESPEYWVRMWDSIRNTSLVRGTAIHDELERQELKKKLWYNYNKVPPVDGRLHMVHEPGVRRIQQLSALTPGVHPELMVWDHNWHIAGRIDKPTIEWRFLPVGTLSRVLHIEDYKTGKFIFRESFKSKESGYLMMKEPVSHLMDCAFSHYCLQLSLYQFMGEYHGYIPGFRRLIHYPHEIEGLGTPDPKPITVPYLRKEVLSMLEHLKNAA